MKSVAVSELRAHLPAFLHQVERGEELVLTSRGKEVARLIPPQSTKAQARKALKLLRKKAQVGDVISPIDVTWDALA